MSTLKVTPLPQVKGTPKRMHSLPLKLGYYAAAIIGIIHVVLAIYLFYQTNILDVTVNTLTFQPPAFEAVIEFFSGIFALIAAFGLRRLQYWGVLSVTVFGAFEVWNGSLVAEVAKFDLQGIISPQTFGNNLTIIFQALGVILIALSVISFFEVRRHRKMAALIGTNDAKKKSK